MMSVRITPRLRYRSVALPRRVESIIPFFPLDCVTPVENQPETVGRLQGD